MSCSIAALVLAAPVYATVGTATWLTSVTTADGDAIVEPGESATIRVMVDMDPSVGETIDGLAGKVWAFGSLQADLLAGAAWDTGEVAWQINPFLIYQLGDQSHKDKTQSILDITVLQADSTGLVDEHDPIEIVTVTWTPTSATQAGSVGFRLDARAFWGFGDDEASVLMRFDGGSARVPYGLVPAEYVFEVIPAPGVLAFPVIGGLAAAPRRRGWGRRGVS